MQIVLETKLTFSQILSDKHFHRLTEGMRCEGTSGDHGVQPPYLEQGQLKQIAHTCVQLDFEYLLECRLHNLCGLFDRYHSKKCLLVSAGCCTEKHLKFALSSLVASFDESQFSYWKRQWAVISCHLLVLQIFQKLPHHIPLSHLLPRVITPRLFNCLSQRRCYIQL